MLKKICLSTFFIFIVVNLRAADSSVNIDSLSSILNIKEKISREKQLLRYISNYFQGCPANELSSAKVAINKFLDKSALESKEAIEYFTESIYQNRQLHDNESAVALIEAIQAAGKSKDDYLSCSLLNFLAQQQTGEGNIIGAVSSYRMAKKDAIKLNDTNLQMIIDINISDVCYMNDFYNESLFYLDQALAIRNRFWPDDERIKNKIYYNKAEIFFRTNKPDSLEVYNEKLKNSKANTYKLYTYKNRTDYYSYLLHHDYKKAINLINKMKNDEGYKFDDGDLRNLSDAYYKNGRLDSAKFIVNELLSKGSETNHPEIKFHLYEVLGEIAEQQNDYRPAVANFKLSLKQSEDNMNRLTQVDKISSLIKVDEIEGYYSQKNESYERERAWLIMAVIFALMIILVIIMFYRTIKQKRHYERLLFTAKKEELSFINSHDVRKHLSNILGLIGVIRHSENKEEDFFQVEGYIFHSAQELDKAIKNISEKLDA